MLQRKESDERFHINSLDGLRGIAVLIVICSHTSNTGWYFLPMLDLRGIGKAGVYLFFLLSAFLLTQPLLHHGKNILSLPVLAHYFQRRFFRIYPIYFLYLCFAALTTWLIHTYINESTNGIPFSLNTTEFIQQIFLLDCKGVTWSIAAEFKFYFILPILAFALYHLHKLHIAVAVSACAILATTLHVLAGHFNFLTNYQSFWVYMPIFLLGMLLALIQKDLNGGTGLPAQYKVIIRILSMLGVIALLLMTPLALTLMGIDVVKEYFHEYYFAYGLAWSAILFTAVNGNGIIQKILCLPVLRFFGAISFSLYLFHPVFIFILIMLHINTAVNAWIVLVCSTFTAYLSFRFLEYPLSKVKLI